MPDVNSFIKALLSTLGAPATPENMAFMKTWQASEGGWNHNNATFNPWNSTKGSQFPGINSVGVRAYPDMQTGLGYTKQTMLNGRYPDIVAGLRDGNPFDNPISDDLQTWVSGNPNGNAAYARRILGAHFPQSSKQTPLQAKGTVPTYLPPRAKPPKQTKAPHPANQALSDFQSAMLNRLLERGRNPALIGLMANRLMASTAPTDEPQAVTDPAHLKKAAEAITPPVSPTTGQVPKSSSPLIQKVLDIAHNQVGKPYIWGAESPKEGGFDCSGLIDYAFRQAGIAMPPGRLTTYTMAKMGKSVKGQDYKPGDWIIANHGEHVVMYVGGGKVIAAPHTGTDVQYQPLSRFAGSIVDVRRINIQPNPAGDR